MKKLLFSVMAVLLTVNVASSQEVALRSNIPTLAFGTLTLGTEFSVAPRWTIGIDGMVTLLNPWKDNGIYMNGWFGVGEARYYLCEAFNGHHFGLYGMVGRHGEIIMEKDFIGDMMIGGFTTRGTQNVKSAFVGISYGYYLKLAHGWGLDFYVGGGASYAMTNKDHKTGVKFGLSRAGIDLSYKF